MKLVFKISRLFSFKSGVYSSFKKNICIDMSSVFSHLMESVVLTVTKEMIASGVFRVGTPLLLYLGYPSKCQRGGIK